MGQNEEETLISNMALDVIDYNGKVGEKLKEPKIVTPPAQPARKAPLTRSTTKGFVRFRCPLKITSSTVSETTSTYTTEPKDQEPVAMERVPEEQTAVDVPQPATVSLEPPQLSPHLPTPSKSLRSPISTFSQIEGMDLLGVDPQNDEEDSQAFDQLLEEVAQQMEPTPAALKKGFHVEARPKDVFMDVVDESPARNLSKKRRLVKRADVEHSSPVQVGV
ncbi:uncharacterized protein EV422DRAFT_313167 [Fimicolochytrium jonesii]|uniref:uncharacterized protein n=1 Tax=Fimicolochytrium jonesii TaxID=1396493 RepID=UPI0022FDB660|nr:uncharacterized protein EV422DRAFT_313167 [Fimicolochytrium jonesii]KAI8824258.1 hypothetical protein EV422DRAFT_313167 [Fimicolochytrium jonesii]